MHRVKKVLFQSNNDGRRWHFLLRTGSIEMLPIECNVKDKVFPNIHFLKADNDRRQTKYSVLHRNIEIGVITDWHYGINVKIITQPFRMLSSLGNGLWTGLKSLKPIKNLGGVLSRWFYEQIRQFEKSRDEISLKALENLVLKAKQMFSGFLTKRKIL